MQRSGGRAQGLKLPTVPQDKLRFRFDVRVDHVSFQADGIDRPLAVALSRGGKVAQTAPVRMGENTRSARNQTLIGHTQTKPRRSRRPRWQILPPFLQRPQLLEALRRLLLFAHHAAASTHRKRHDVAHRTHHARRRRVARRVAVVLRLAIIGRRFRGARVVEDARLCATIPALVR